MEKPIEYFHKVIKCRIIKENKILGDYMEIKAFKDFLKITKSMEIGGLFVLGGQEKHLVNESVKILYSLIKSFPEINIITLEGEAINKDNIVNAFESIPFMSDIKIIHIKNAAFLKKLSRGSGEKKIKNQSTSEVEELLYKYAEQVTRDIIIIITVDGEVDDKSKIYLTAKRKGIAAQYNYLKGVELQNWIIDIVKDYGKVISKSDVIYLISLVGQSMDQIKGEIDKVCSYCVNEGTITREKIDIVVSRSLESNIFKMVDNISKKDAENAIAILNTLLFQKEDYLRILGMIIRQFRLMLTIKLHQESGTQPQVISSKLKLNDFVFQNMLRICNTYESTSLKKAMKLCLEMDYDIKRGKYSPDMGLEVLIVMLCK